MNKYALTLPLLLVSIFLGYYGSSLPREQGYAFFAVIVVVATIAGYLLVKRFRKPKQNSTITGAGG